MGAEYSFAHLTPSSQWWLRVQNGFFDYGFCAESAEHEITRRADQINGTADAGKNGK